jgi:DNA-binding GntR family transcriptional regulator
MLEDRSDRIDRSSPRLLSEQLADDLRTEIRGGKVTGRLPSELELAEQYQTARVTVRSAMAILVQEGYVVVVRGRGAFAADRFPGSVRPRTD